jgi:drug/metabolite transporter (DMT)-like permease
MCLWLIQNNMNSIVLALILFTVVFNTAAQVFLKMGMNRIGGFVFHWSSFIPITLKAIASPWIMLGVIAYIGSLGVWLMVLSRTSVSIAYPMASLAYITSAIAAYYVLGENLSMLRIAGIIVILIGVYMVAKS